MPQLPNMPQTETSEQAHASHLKLHDKLNAHEEIALFFDGLLTYKTDEYRLLDNAAQYCNTCGDLGQTQATETESPWFLRENNDASEIICDLGQQHCEATAPMRAIIRHTIEEILEEYECKPGEPPQAALASEEAKLVERLQDMHRITDRCCH